MRRLAELLRRLHAPSGTRWGNGALVNNGGSSHGTSCERRMPEGALWDIEEAAGRDGRVNAVRGEPADMAEKLDAVMEPRAEHALNYGELGPDRVLLTPDGSPALIDIESLRYFDVRRPPRPRPGRGPAPAVPAHDASEPRRGAVAAA